MNATAEVGQVTQRGKRRKLLLVVVALVAVVAFHWRAFIPKSEVYFDSFADVTYIRAGYNSVPDVWSAIVRFSTGQWIHTGEPAFRPLSSLLHYGQLYAIDAGYLPAITVTTLLMLAAVCVLAGALVRRWANDTAALIAAVVCAAVPANWGVPGVDQFAAFWVTDNLLCMIGLLAALLAFDTWMTTSEQRHALLSLGFLLFAALSKEYAYIIPGMFAVLYYCPTGQHDRTRHYWPVIAAFFMVAVLILYRRAVVPASYHSSLASVIESYWSIYSGISGKLWGESNGSLLMTDQWLRVLIDALPLVPVLLALRFLLQVRNGTRISASELLLFLSFAPIIEYALFTHRLIFPWTFAAMLVAPALSGLLKSMLSQYYVRVRLHQKRSRPI